MRKIEKRVIILLFPDEKSKYSITKNVAINYCQNHHKDYRIDTYDIENNIEDVFHGIKKKLVSVIELYSINSITPYDLRQLYSLCIKNDINIISVCENIDLNEKTGHLQIMGDIPDFV